MPAAQLGFLPSLDHFIRSIQHRLRCGQTDLLRCFQIYHQLKLSRLLHRQISRLGSHQDPVHVICDAPVDVRLVCCVGHEAAGIYKFSGGQREDLPRLSSGHFPYSEVVRSDTRRGYGSRRSVKNPRNPVGPLPTVQPSSKVTSSHQSRYAPCLTSN